MADVEKLVEAMSASIEKFQGVQASMNDELKKTIGGTADETKAAVAQCNALAEQIKGISAQILEIEQKTAENVRAGKAPVETLGQMTIKSDAYKQYAQGGGLGHMRFQANTITGQSGSPAENSDILVAPQRLAGIIPGSSRLLRVKDIMPQGVTSSNMVEYTRELAWTNNAAETSEGVTKPESSLTFELVNAPVRTIAHWIKVSKQVLDDAPQLQSYIDTRMRYGVDYREDAQLLNGNGTNPNISGLTDSGNFTAFTPTTGENALDSINRAIYAVYAADYAPTAILMNPQDWGAIERIKRGSSDASYVVGSPTGILGPMLWGLPVVVTNAMTQGYFMVGSFDIAAQVWNRTGTVVELFAQDDTNVQKNLLTLRAEKRTALAIYRPTSLRYGALTL